MVQGCPVAMDPEAILIMELVDVVLLQEVTTQVEVHGLAI